MSYKDIQLSKWLYTTISDIKDQLEKMKLTKEPIAFWCEESNTIYYNSPFIYDKKIPEHIQQNYINYMKKIEEKVIQYLKNKKQDEKLKKLNKQIVYLHIDIL